MADTLNVRKTDLLKIENSWCQMFCLFGIVFFTQGNINVHMFSYVFEWIVSNNKWLTFLLSVWNQKIHFFKKEEIFYDYHFENWHLFILMGLDRLFWIINYSRMNWRTHMIDRLGYLFLFVRVDPLELRLLALV